jgi:RsiW-degrading membrane proteinase PrsW (M82 family)
MLLFGFLVLLGFCFALESFENPKMVPGLIIVGAFFVPLACVTLFFEFNVLRNISLYEVLKLIVGGGVASLIIALFLFATTGLHETFMGATAAGIVEEIAKALAAVFLIRGSLQYKWILNGLLVGAAVGAGFAGFESAGYMLEALFRGLANDEGLSGLYETLAIRAVFAPFCHVVWTASVVGALWRVKKDQPFQMNMFFHKDFLRVLAFVMLLHMLWNSNLLWVLPRNAGLLKGELYLWLVSIVGSWYLALLLVQEGLLQVKTAKQLA